MIYGPLLSIADKVFELSNSIAIRFKTIAPSAQHNKGEFATSPLC
jgi:hypothetical protein